MEPTTETTNKSTESKLLNHYTKLTFEKILNVTKIMKLI